MLCGERNAGAGIWPPMGRLGNTNTPLTPPSELNHHHVHVRVLELVSTVVQVAVPCGAAQGTSVGPFSLVSLTDTDLWHKHILLFSAAFARFTSALCP